MKGRKIRLFSKSNKSANNKRYKGRVSNVFLLSETVNTLRRLTDANIKVNLVIYHRSRPHSTITLDKNQEKISTLNVHFVLFLFKRTRLLKLVEDERIFIIYVHVLGFPFLTIKDDVSIFEIPYDLVSVA